MNKSHQLHRHDSRAPATLTATVPPWTSRATIFGTTIEWVTSVRLAWLLCVIGHRPLFPFFILLSSHHSIRDFEVSFLIILVSTSYLTSHFVAFWGWPVHPQVVLVQLARLLHKSCLLECHDSERTDLKNMFHPNLFLKFYFKKSQNKKKSKNTLKGWQAHAFVLLRI
jgi:hypothetical protein